MPKTTVLPYRPPARLPAPVMAAILLFAGAILGSCASTRTSADSGLSGRWRLDAAASDNVSAQIKKAVDGAESRLRRRRGAGRFGTGGRPGNGAGGGAGSAGGGDANGSGPDDSLATADEFGNITRIGPDFRQLRERLLQALDAPSTLRLDVQPDRIDIQSDGLPARDYQPGERFTRVDEYGTAVLDSRWADNAFLLRERYTSGAKLTERYQIGPDGTLVCTRSLVDPTIGKLELKSVYQRGPNEP
ncbi:MAG TPA: hypothetical protein VHX52_11455 [Steroidobacteraceae bacterium]|jgi:hypothetical protein|nr:hypothetical protein [Steroidobacteraceae bacterium]